MLNHQYQKHPANIQICGYSYFACYQGRRESRGGPEKSFHARSAQKYSRRGQLNNGVRRTSKCLSMLTVKALLIILPKCSLIEFRQCNGNRKKRKQHEDAAQKGKIIKIKASWGPLKVWEPHGTIPCSPPPFSAGLVTKCI